MSCAMLLLFTVASVASVWGYYRFDTFESVGKISSIASEMVVTSLYDCKETFFKDPSYIAFSYQNSNVIKITYHICQFANDPDVIYNINAQSNSITYIKNRKPKRYFWSVNKTNIPSPNVFQTICNSEGGQPGIILTQDEFNYVDSNLMSAITSSDGWHIPLFSLCWMNSTMCVNKNNGIFASKNENTNKPCFRLKVDSPMKLSGEDCDKDDANHKKPILCSVLE